MACSVQPDGGYAWVVLLALCLQNVINCLQHAALGIFLVHFLHYFNTSKTVVSWIGMCAGTMGHFLGDCFVFVYLNHINVPVYMQSTRGMYVQSIQRQSEACPTLTT